MKRFKLISVFLLSFLFYTSNIFALSDMYSIGERDSSNNYGVNKSKIEVTDSNKSNVLKNLGLNLNLAPVVDVSTDPNDYMYNRALGEDTITTVTFAETVIEASKGKGVSYVLKHFPGYGNNADTHTGTSTDNRPLEDIKNNDLPPLSAGIKKEAEAVLVSHNIVDSIDSSNAASLSPSAHNLLRNELSFTGVVITDDLAMGAVSSISDNAVKAVLAGNKEAAEKSLRLAIKSLDNAKSKGLVHRNKVDREKSRLTLKVNKMDK